jgi:FixJ family two-component response regulator
MVVSYGDVAILIVDDNFEICESLVKLISLWGYDAQATTNPLEVIERLKAHFYNLIILDILMPEKTGIDLIPEISDLSPDTKIIIITGYADKRMALEALRLGAFDFLEKPVEAQLLRHSIRRALDMQKAEIRYREILDKLRSNRNDLLTYKTRLETVNEQLLGTNKALSIMAKDLEDARNETEKQVVSKIRSLIIPIVEKLQDDANITPYRPDLNMLLRHIEDLTSGLATEVNEAELLSTTELRVASLIKTGLTTDSIARHLHISPSTVKTHRRNIRRKLGINNHDQGLRDYLKSDLNDQMQ